MYVNGSLVHTFNPTFRQGSLDNNTALWLGRHRANPCAGVSNFFAGQLDEVEIFKRALTEPEIRDIFNAGSSGKCKDCRPLPDGTACNDTLCRCRQSCKLGKRQFNIFRNRHRSKKCSGLECHAHSFSKLRQATRIGCEKINALASDCPLIRTLQTNEAPE